MGIENNNLPPGVTEWKAPKDIAPDEVISGGIGLPEKAGSSSDLEMEISGGIGLPEKVDVGAKETIDTEKIGRTVAELKQDAKLKYEKVVEPTIAEIEALCAKFPDPESFLGDKGILKDVKELFAMSGHFRALDEMHMAHLQEIKQYLSDTLKRDELLKAKNPGSKPTTLEQAVNNMYERSLDFSNPGLQPSWDWNWELKARIKLQDQEKQK